MNTRQLHAVLIRFYASFRAYFPLLIAQDLRTILAGPSETLLEILQIRYGYTRAEAIAAWNDFVLAHVDGHCSRGPEPSWDAGWVMAGLCLTPRLRLDYPTVCYLH